MTDERRVIAVTGGDRAKFLDGLVTCHVPVPGEGLAYGAILTPQGKLIADFFLLAEAERILMDLPEAVADTLTQRLSMYKLRADVALEETGLAVARGIGPPPDGAFADPRDTAMGWRAYVMSAGTDDTDWDALRVAALVPAFGAELGPESYPLEMGFDRMGGVDFRKGCYVGQEVTARMKHKTELRKGLARVRLSGDAPPPAPGTEILAEGKPAGTLHTVAGNRALAYLRFDRARGEMRAGQATAVLEATVSAPAEPSTK